MPAEDEEQECPCPLAEEPGPECPVPAEFPARATTDELAECVVPEGAVLLYAREQLPTLFVLATLARVGRSRDFEASALNAEGNWALVDR